VRIDALDDRNALVVSGTTFLPRHIAIGAIWTLRSSLPFSAFSGTFDIDGTQQYVPGTSRNQGNRDLGIAAVNSFRAGLGLSPIAPSQIQSSRYNDFDLRVAKSIFIRNEMQIEVVGQAFNLFGSTNLLEPYVNSNAQSPAFGQISNASNAQEGELAVRFVF
jgi:hypothetical protein